jgi:hypothetical protein
MEMTSSDRQALIRIIRKRAALAKSGVAEREQILQNEALEMLSTEYRLHEEMHAGYIRAAHEAINKVNEQLKQQAELMGYNPANLPLATLRESGYYDYRGDPRHKAARWPLRRSSSWAAWKATRPGHWWTRCRHRKP